MKPTYARPRKGPRTLLRFVLGTLLMKLAPDFMSFIGIYDITGVQESKLGDVDKIQVPGYQVFFFFK